MPTDVPLLKLLSKLVMIFCSHPFNVRKLAGATGLALALVSWPGPDAAAQLAETRISPVTAAGTPSSRNVNVTLSKARIIDLPVPVRDVLIANPGVAEIVIKSPRRVYLLGRSVGATNAFFFDSTGKEVFRAEISVRQDIERVKEAIRSLLPDVEIKVTTVNNNLFLTGRVRSAEISENIRQIALRFVGGAASLVNLLEVLDDQQVMLRVRISEVRRNALKQVGVNLFQLITAAGNLSFRATSRTLNPGNRFFTGVLGYDNQRRTRIDLALNALEANGLTRTLAEPNLIAISGESATFLAGGEIPIPITDQNGNVNVTFEPFGVQLRFTPLVLNSGRIRLEIDTEVSSLDFASGVGLPGGTTVPALATKRAQTVVELPSGGSMMLAGLLDDTLSANVSGVPGVKDVPILGALFRNNTLQRQENELVVMVTAILIKPVRRRDQLKEPIDHVAPPSDYDLYALGQIQALYAPGERSSMIRNLRGPIGYIVR